MKLLRGLNMKLSKKILAVAAVLAASAMVFVGCAKDAGGGDAAQASGNKVTLNGTNDGTVKFDKDGDGVAETTAAYVRSFATINSTKKSAFTAEVTLNKIGSMGDSVVGVVFDDLKSGDKSTFYLAGFRYNSTKKFQFYISKFSNVTDKQLKPTDDTSFGTETQIVKGTSSNAYATLGGITTADDKATFYVKVSQDTKGTYHVAFFSDKNCTNPLTVSDAVGANSNGTVDIIANTESKKAEGLIGGYCNILNGKSVDAVVKFFGIKEAAEVVEE